MPHAAAVFTPYFVQTRPVGATETKFTCKWPCGASHVAALLRERLKKANTAFAAPLRRIPRRAFAAAAPCKLPGEINRRGRFAAANRSRAFLVPFCAPKKELCKASQSFPRRDTHGLCRVTLSLGLVILERAFFRRSGTNQKKSVRFAHALSEKADYLPALTTACAAARRAMGTR